MKAQIAAGWTSRNATLTTPPDLGRTASSSA
jgi:hypothetical protein